MVFSIILQRTILNKFKMHSEDEKQKHTVDGNTYEIANSNQDQDPEDEK